MLNVVDSCAFVVCPVVLLLGSLSCISICNYTSPEMVQGFVVIVVMVVVLCGSLF